MNPAAFPAIFPSTATGAMLILISSMSGNSNSPAMKLIEATYDDGTKVVKKLDWRQGCSACRRKGIAETCTHFSKLPQFFQSVASMARLAKLLGATNPDAYKIEMEYVYSFQFTQKNIHLLTLYRNQQEESPTSFAFKSAEIDRMVNHSYRLNEDIKYLFITVDPAGGKGLNLYAVCSTVFTSDGTCVVCLSFFQSSLNMYCERHRSMACVASSSPPSVHSMNRLTKGCISEMNCDVFMTEGG